MPAPARRPLKAVNCWQDEAGTFVTKNLKTFAAVCFGLALVCGLVYWFTSQPMAMVELKNPEAWLTDLPAALAQAKAEHKNVLLDFTGSDWCPPCNALRKTVFNTPQFEAYAKTNLVLMLVDFPQLKELSPELTKANADLAKKYGVDGFPTTIIVDVEGKALVTIKGYVGETADQFIAKLKPAATNQPAAASPPMK